MNLSRSLFRFGTKKLFVGGNWKSNNTLQQSKDLVGNVINKLKYDPAKLDVIISPPFLHIPAVQQALTNKSVEIAAQNASVYGFGAYTGEISPNHIKDLGINWVILGHSERRQLFGESDQLVADKVSNALKNKLNVIFCFGETLEERKADKTKDVITRQLHPLKKLIEAAKKDSLWWEDLVLAYEPVWAIGTGLTATPEQAQEVHGWLRESLKASCQTPSNIRIIYGGSVTEKNTAELIKQKDIDGFLVGGAALKPAFLDIVRDSHK